LVASCSQAIAQPEGRTLWSGAARERHVRVCVCARTRACARVPACVHMPTCCSSCAFSSLRRPQKRTADADERAAHLCKSFVQRDSVVLDVGPLGGGEVVFVLVRLYLQAGT